MPFDSSPMPDLHPLAKLLQHRIAIIDGAMGTTIRTYGMSEQDIRGARFADSEEGSAQQRRPLLAHPAEDDLRYPPALPRSRRRHHRDQHLRGDEHHPERVLRRRPARARRPQGRGLLPEDHRRSLPQRSGLGDQRAVRAAVPRVGRSRRHGGWSTALRRRRDRAAHRLSPTHPTPTTPASAW